MDLFKLWKMLMSLLIANFKQNFSDTTIVYAKNHEKEMIQLLKNSSYEKRCVV
jgi:hypothetical protein